MDIQVRTKVIKRNGEEVDFHLEKIINAIKAANKEVDKIHQMNEYQIIAIADNIALKVRDFTHAVNVEDIQDMVETGIMEMRGYEVAQKYVDLLKTKTPGVDQLVVNLSGGNQQKVVIAKWLVRNCDILIFDEPTRGIDVGAKSEIYQLMNQLAEEGKSIIMISSEMTEILRMSDRIIVMCEGKVTGEIDIAEATQENIMHAATLRN